jgi:hypothetical protein
MPCGYMSLFFLIVDNGDNDARENMDILKKVPYIYIVGSTTRLNRKFLVLKCSKPELRVCYVCAYGAVQVHGTTLELGYRGKRSCLQMQSRVSLAQW